MAMLQSNEILHIGRFGLQLQDGVGLVGKIGDQELGMLEQGIQVVYDSWFQCGPSVGWSPKTYWQIFLPLIKEAVDLAHQYDAVYIYQDDGLGNWLLVDTLTAFDGAANDEFGYRVDISGDLVIIGTNYNDQLGADAGAAYIYRDDGLGNWLLVEKRTAIDGAAGDYFGDHVGITGSDGAYTTIISAPGDDPSGAVYITARVPEPGTLVLLSLGSLVGLAARRRRRAG